MPNRLAAESSPYLQQHRDNPVDWYPWGEEALARASTEDRPILLSIGYASCHWCHVMAHESFENEAIAAQINANFVPVKVDREERPDIDSIYMSALQAMTGHGGWPLNIFLTPDAVPFFGGTYWPPEDRQGMPGLPRVLGAVASQWAGNRDAITTTADQIHTYLQQASASLPPSELDDYAAISEAALSTLLPQLDPVRGGLKGAPRFPQASMLEFLLVHHRRTGRAEALEALTRALDGMANGGLYDQLGGGFSRYSVDDRWLVPHFEKMLYDNAQLLSIYVDAYLVTGSDRYRTVIEETAAWLIREMQDEPGGFYAALDADSEGEEGRFYVWTKAEVEALLSPIEADWVSLHFGISAEGNFEGNAVLQIARPVDELAAALGEPTESLRRVIDEARSKLLATRSQRIRPGTDTKLVVSWNGLAIGALAKAGIALDQPNLITAASRAADRILQQAVSEDGKLARLLTTDGGTGNGLLEDYAYLSWGLLELYAATGEYQYLKTARALADSAVQRFPAEVGFFDTAIDHEALIVRPRDVQDGATPSGNAVMLRVLQHLSHLLPNDQAHDRVSPYLGALARPMAEHPAMFGYALALLEHELANPRHVVLVGNEASRLQRVIAERYEPFTTVAWPVPEDQAEQWPTLSGHTLPADETAAAFICEGMSCLPPISDVDGLIAALERVSP